MENQTATFRPAYLKQIDKKQLRVNTSADETQLLAISYRTPIILIDASARVAYVTPNKYSVTTSKHKNHILKEYSNYFNSVEILPSHSDLIDLWNAQYIRKEA